MNSAHDLPSRMTVCLAKAGVLAGKLQYGSAFGGSKVRASFSVANWTGTTTFDAGGGYELDYNGYGSGFSYAGKDMLTRETCLLRSSLLLGTCFSF